MIIGLIIGAVIGYIPFNADSSFRYSIESGNPDKIYITAKKWPRDTIRMLYAAQIFRSNQVEDKAVELARLAIKENPRSFESWKFLYNSPNINLIEKNEIFHRLKQLDPNNKFLKK